MIRVSIDGRILAAENAQISVFDRGFLYGDSVFETLRTYRGKPFALTEHLERFQTSASLVHIPMPVSPAEWRREISALLASVSNPESYLRVMLTRGQGPLGLDPALAEVPRRVLIAAELEALPVSVYENGVATITWRTQRYPDATPAQGAKIGNYLVSVLAMREARQTGAHEALIVNRLGQVVEGASSNLFWVVDGKLLTPPLGAGILAGITRAFVLSLAERLAIASELATPSIDDLHRADEAFISSTLRELVPVVAVDGQQVGEGRPGPLTQRLHQAYRAMVDEKLLV